MAMPAVDLIYCLHQTVRPLERTIAEGIGDEQLILWTNEIVSSTEEAEQIARSYLQRWAGEDANRGKFSDALKSLKQALESNPQHLRALSI